MEILKRARGEQEGEGISAFESEENVKEEVMRRSAKAGYTTRNGEPIHSTKVMVRGFGKGKLNKKKGT